MTTPPKFQYRPAVIYLLAHHPTKYSLSPQPENLRCCRTVRVWLWDSGIEPVGGLSEFCFQIERPAPHFADNKISALFLSSPSYSSPSPPLSSVKSFSLRVRESILQYSEKKRKETNQEVMTRKIIYGASLAAFVAGTSLRHLLRLFSTSIERNINS